MYGLLQYSRIQFALVSLDVKFTFSTSEWNSTHLCSLYLFTATLHQNWDNYVDSPWLLMISKCCPYRPTIGCMHHALFKNEYLYNFSFQVSESSTYEDLLAATQKIQDYLANAGCLRPLRNIEDKEQLVHDILMFQVVHRVQAPFQR